MVKQSYKFGEKRRKAFLQLIQEGQRRSIAADNVGISRETVRQYYRDMPEFREAVDIAEMGANDLIEDALFQAALSGNVRAIEIWLYNRSSERWVDKRQAEHKVVGELGIKIIDNVPGKDDGSMS